MHAGFLLAEAESSRPGRSSFAVRLGIRIDEAVVEAAEYPGATAGQARSQRWLAGRLAGFGLRLDGGQIILMGSPMRRFPVAPGSRVVVEAHPLGRSVAEIDP